MLFEHRNYQPSIHPTAFVAPTAVVSGDVTIGPETVVLHGAIITAEGGSVCIGSRCVIMETAVLRGTKRHPLHVGSNVLIGPRSYFTGCHVGDAVFLATGSTVFNDARIGIGSTIRINGTVHLRTELAPESVVPIGWIAVGRPASILPPNAHEEIWALQESLDFPREVFGVTRAPGSTMMPKVCRRYTRSLVSHRNDRQVDT